MSGIGEECVGGVIVGGKQFRVDVVLGMSRWQVRVDTGGSLLFASETHVDQIVKLLQRAKKRAREKNKMLVTGVYVVHAETDDGIIHRAELYVRSQNDLAIRFRCRPLVIDGHGDARSHLRGAERLVDCMTCLTKARNE